MTRLLIASLVVLMACAGCSSSPQSTRTAANDAEYQELVEKARQHIDSGESDEAVSVLSRAIDKNPSAPIALQLRGQIYVDKRDYKRAIEDLSKAIAADKNAYEARLDRSGCYKMEGDGSKAEADLDAVIAGLGAKDTTSLDSASRMQLCAAYVGKGDLRSEEQKHDASVAEYTKAIELAPDHATAWASRGGEHLLAENGTDAEADIEKALLLDPSNLNALCWKVRLERHPKFGDPAAVNEWIDKLMANAQVGSPSYYAGLLYRGQSRLRDKEFGAGIEDLLEYLKYDEDPALLNKIAWTLAACPDDSVRDGRKAVELAEKAHDLDAKETAYLETLAAAYAEVGNFEKAIELQEKVLQDEEYAKEFGTEARQQLEGFRQNKPARDQE